MHQMMLHNGKISLLGVVDEESDRSLAICKYHDYISYQNIFNPIFSLIKVNDIILNHKFHDPLEHRQSFDVTNNVFKRKTIFLVDGVHIEIASERFVDNETRCIYLNYSFKTDKSIALDFYHGIQKQNDMIFDDAITSNQLHEITLDSDDIHIKLYYDKDFNHKNHSKDDDAIEHYQITTEANRLYSIKKYIAINYKESIDETYLKSRYKQGYDDLFTENKKIQSKMFYNNRIKVVNSKKTQEIIDFCVRHLINYKGFSMNKHDDLAFFSTLYYYILNDIEKARDILLAMLNKLSIYQEKALELGYLGALVYEDEIIEKHGFKIMNGALLVHGIDLYYEYSQDIDFLEDVGFVNTYEIIKFYMSYAYYDKEKEQYNFDNVSNIDESIQHIDNHTLTNYLIKKSLSIFKKHYSLLKKHRKIKELESSNDLAFKEDIKMVDHMIKNIKVFEPGQDGIIMPYENFIEDYQQGVYHLVKDKIHFTFDQMFVLLMDKDQYSHNTIEKNLNYLSEHSYPNMIHQVIKALLDFGNENQIQDILLNMTDLNHYGIFITKAGLNMQFVPFVYYILVYHYSGLKRHGNHIVLDALLPNDIRRLEYNIKFRDFHGEIKIKRNSARLTWQN
jgi:trehalose/maltose hydrolase-like predicted phosphorylase